MNVELCIFHYFHMKKTTVESDRILVEIINDRSS